MRYNRVDVLTVLFVLTIISSPSLPHWNLGILYLRPADIATVVLLAYVLLGPRKISIRRVDFRLMTPLIVFGAYSYLMAIYQPFGITRATIQLIELIQIVLVYLVLTQLLVTGSNRIQEVIFHSILIAAAWTSLLSIYTALNTGSTSAVLSVTPILGSGVILAIGFIQATVYYIDTRRKIYVVLLVLIFVALMYRSRRSELLFIPVALLSALMLYSPSLNWRKIGRISGIAGGGGILAYVLSLPGTTRLRYLVEADENIFEIFEGRSTRWGGGIDAFLSFPFGAGLGNFSAALEYVANEIGEFNTIRQILDEEASNSAVASWQDGGSGSHSTFFRMLVEGGIVGVSMFLMFWWLILLRATSVPKNRVTIIGIAVLTYIFFAAVLNQGWIYSQARGHILMLFVAILMTGGYSRE